MERFESLIDDVKEINLNIITAGYSDMTPWADDHLDISAIRVGEEEHVYRFTGPGVKKFYEKFCENLSDAKIIMNNEKLREENKELKKENEDFGNQILEYIEMNNRKQEENEKLKQMNDNLEQERELLLKENDKLRYSFDDLSEENKKLRKRIDALKGRKESTSREDILDQAKKCVCGQREQDYGTPESNFQLIADLWNGYLGNTLSKEMRDFEKELGITHKHKELSVPWKISAMDVSMMMALMKIARIRNGGGSGDSFVDLAGYAACGGEIWHGERHSDK